MSQRDIVTYPDQTLRKNSAEVTEFDAQLEKLVEDLFDTLNALGEGSGIGLSAPQIGINKRVSVVHVPDDEFGPRAYVNPLVISRSAYGLVEESCLSVPDTAGNVIRATQVCVQAQNIKGERFESDVSGMHAVCLLHEIDHLDGTLFIDRLSWFRRWQVKNRLKKQYGEAAAAKAG